MYELLFQNQPITWIGSGVSSFGISFGLFVLLIICYLGKNRWKIKPRMQGIIVGSYQRIGEHDREYVSKTIHSIKEYLGVTLHIDHALAFTAEELDVSMDRHTLSSILRELEYIQYSGQILSSDRCASYNERIEKELSSRIQ